MNLANSGRWVEPEAGFLEIKIQAAVKGKKSPILAHGGRFDNTVAHY